MTPVTPPGPSPPSSAARAGRPVISRFVAVGMLAAVVAVAVVVALAVIAFTSTDDPSPGAGWNTLVGVDRENGFVTVHDESGEPVDRISTGIDQPTPHVVSSAHLVLNGLRADRPAIAIVDIISGDVTDIDRQVDTDGRRLQVQPIRHADAFVVGDVVDPGTAWVVTVDGDVVDVGAEAGWDEPFVFPLAAQSTPDGSHVALVNLNPDQFESAIVALDDLEVTVVDGNAISLTNDRVRTTPRNRDPERVGVESYNLSGERIESFEVDRFRVAIDASNGDLLTAGDDGYIVRWTPEGDSELLAEFDVGDGGDVGPFTRTEGATPTIAVADDGGELLLVNSDGDVFEDFRLSAPVDRFELGRRCLPVITETSVAVVEAETGEVLVEQDVGFGPALLGASDGDACNIVVVAEEAVLIGADDVVEFAPRETPIGLSQDGTAYATRGDGDVDVHGLGARAADDDISLDVDGSVHVFFLRR